MKHLYATLISILLFAAPIRAQFTPFHYYCQNPKLNIDRNHNFTLIGNAQHFIDLPAGVRITIGGTYGQHISFFYIAQLDSSYNLKWIRTYDNGLADLFYSADAVVDDDGAVYYTMYTEAGATLDSATEAWPIGGGAAFIIVKYDTIGRLVWYKISKTDLNLTYHYKMGRDAANNIYHLAYTKSFVSFNVDDTIHATPDMPATVITKFDSGGNIIWTHALYGKKLLADMKVDPSGNVAITGSCQGPQVVGTDTVPVTGNIPFVYKCDSAANPLWFRTMSGKPGNIGSAVTHLPDSTVVVIGCITDTMYTDTATAPTLPISATNIFLNKYRHNSSPDSAIVTGKNLNNAPVFDHIHRNIYTNPSGGLVLVAGYSGGINVKLDTTSLSLIHSRSSVVALLDTAYHYKCHMATSYSTEPQVTFDAEHNIYLSGKTIARYEPGIHFSMLDTSFYVYGEFIYILSADATCKLKNIQILPTPFLPHESIPHITLQHQLSIAPNPAHNLVQVNCTTITGPTTTSVYSIDGRHLLTSHSLHPSTLLTTSTLPSGTYIVRMTNKETSATGTFIKQ